MRVFISYSHDSVEHEKAVRELATDLEGHRHHVVLDQFDIAPPQGWPRWMEDEIEEADIVLLVCTRTYLERFRARGKRGKGRGAVWEATIITVELYESQGRNERFIPVILSEADREHVPKVLRAGDIYDVSNAREYAKLCKRLTERTNARSSSSGTGKSHAPGADPARTIALQGQVATSGPPLVLHSRSEGTAAGALQSRLEIEIWPSAARNVDRGLPVHAGSRLHVLLEVDRPSFLYVLWINGSGTTQPLYPWKDGKWVARHAERALDRLWLPLPGPTGDYGAFVVDATGGTESLVLAARGEPLDETAHRELPDALTGFPRGRMPADPSRAYQFAIERSALRLGLRYRLGIDPEEAEDPVEQVRVRLHDRLAWRFDSVHALSFGNAGKG